MACKGKWKSVAAEANRKRTVVVSCPAFMKCLQTYFVVSVADPYTQVKIVRFHDTYFVQLVPAIYFHNMWPYCANAWGQEDATTSWLTPEVTSHCRHMGFFAVPQKCPYRSRAKKRDFRLTAFVCVCVKLKSI